MSKAVKNIIVRVIKNRMAAGEQFEDIIKDYPKLTEAEIAEIKESLDIQKNDNIKNMIQNDTPIYV